MIYTPVSVGELIDKLSILQVKKTKINNEEKLDYINKEFELLYDLSLVYLENKELEKLYHILVKTNSKLWDIEDKLRVFESKKRFDEEFIKLSRSVYFTNDERFILKNQINKITDSEIREIKEYIKYQ
jgi:hypothetical protein